MLHVLLESFPSNESTDHHSRCVLQNIVQCVLFLFQFHKMQHNILLNTTQFLIALQLALDVKLKIYYVKYANLYQVRH